MSRANRAVEPTAADLVTKLSESAAVTRFRASTRGGIRIEDMATGETVEIEGPVLFLAVNERLLSAGW